MKATSRSISKRRRLPTEPIVRSDVWTMEPTFTEDVDDTESSVARALTPEEIQAILSRIQRTSPFPDVTTSVLHRIHQDVITQLRQIVVYPAILPELITRIERMFQHAQIAPGESVGILMAQSIGERQTQLTLNSFHSTGATIATVVTGVPRFKELLSATKNPRGTSMTLRIHDQFPDLRQVRLAIHPRLVYLTIRNVVERVHATQYRTHRWYGLSAWRQGDAWDATHLNAFRIGIVLTLNPQQLYEYRISPEHIRTMILQAYAQEDICPCVLAAPTALVQIHVWIPSESSRSNRAWLEDIQSIALQGIPGIGDAVYQQERERQDWMVVTQGSNFIEFMKCEAWVDIAHSLSNHMWELYQLFGIEAVRAFLIQEFTQVISVDAYINARHIELLVDIMTSTGSIASVSRFGVQRNQSGPITKATFEETLDNFLKASVYGDIETTRGISATIVVGKPSRMGSGFCSLLQDPDSQ